MCIIILDFRETHDKLPFKGILVFVKIKIMYYYAIRMAGSKND